MIIIFRLLIIFIVVLWNSAGGISALECLDENGDSVDWFVVYKLPEIAHSTSLISNGSAYLYITSKSLADGWIHSEQPITSQHSLVAETLAPLYRKDNDSLWVVYNDQNGRNARVNYGHTKGVVGANRNGGFWLIHSVPNFPLLNEKFSYPETGHRYGQSMLCVSLLQDQVDILGTVFKYNKPKILEKKISTSIKTLYPNLVSAAKGTTIIKAPWKMTTTITSAGGRKFTIFAKATKFHRDLYEWVAAEFKTNIFAETWLNEVHPLPSTCGTFQVMNVQTIEFQDQYNSPVIFSSHKDHSKWAISTNDSKPWVCIGDINRAIPQEKRGGGTMCLEDSALWEAYRNIIDKTSKCTSSRYKHNVNHIQI